jgi:hypothetical protein
MTRFFWMVPAIALLSGCLRIEFPNIVSDAVKAGKDVIGSVSGKNDDKPSGKGIVFSNTVIADAGSAPAMLEGQCLRELETQAKQKLGSSQIAYKVLAREVTIKGDRLVATCSLEML